MEKNYETFVNNLRERLLKATGYQEEMICYKTAEEYPPTDGDRLLLKNRQREGVYEVCALYVADLYEWHQNGATMERIVQEIMHRLDAIVRSECFEKSKDLEDYEKIKKRNCKIRVIAYTIPKQIWYNNKNLRFLRGTAISMILSII